MVTLEVKLDKLETKHSEDFLRVCKTHNTQ